MAFVFYEIVADGEFGASVWNMWHPTDAVLQLERAVHCSEVWNGMPDRVAEGCLRMQTVLHAR